MTEKPKENITKSTCSSCFRVRCLCHDWRVWDSGAGATRKDAETIRAPAPSIAAESFARARGDVEDAFISVAINRKTRIFRVRVSTLTQYDAEGVS